MTGLEQQNVHFMANRLFIGGPYDGETQSWDAEHNAVWAVLNDDPGTTHTYRLVGDEFHYAGAYENKPLVLRAPSRYAFKAGKLTPLCPL
jgi:hypothetical protein